MSSEPFLPPSSAQYLEALFQKVFLPAKLGQFTNILTFSGAGKWANLNFLSDHTKRFDENYPTMAYMALDASQLAFSLEQELQNGLAFMLSRAIKQGNEQLRAFASTQSPSLTLPEFLTSILKLVNTNAVRLILVIDNAHVLLAKNRKAQLARSFLEMLEQLHLANVSLIFITKAEMPADLSHMGRLEKYFTQRVVTEAEIPYDEQCIAAYIRRFKVTRAIDISETMISNIQRNAYGMPVLSKYFTQEIPTNKDLSNVLSRNSVDARELYDAASVTFLDDVFEKIIASLSASSRDFLYGISQEVTPYLRSSGLIATQGKPLNPLFAHYLRVRSSRFTVTTGITGLTPREKRVFELLENFLDKMVSREEIARALWPDDWQTSFSEQSIDKVISSIRAKLPTKEYQLESAKGVGVKLLKLV